jgi:cobalt/nickel transport protein
MTFFRFARRVALVAGALISITATSAEAHFQLLYTPEVNVSRAGDLPIRLICWHPFENGHAMDMARPEAFYMVHRGEKTDLSPSLTPITFTGAENQAQAYAATLPIKRSGDYIMVTVPAPYFESSEEIYIQQITKSMVSRNGIPTDWDQELGLKAEIVPLNRPTNVLAGSSFSGRVMADGKPVAGASVEIEYISALPEIDQNRASAATVTPPEGGTLVAVTDSQGVFTFGIPFAGFWGFAALNIGPDKTYQGKPLSQDAVLWIRAYALSPTRSETE